MMSEFSSPTETPITAQRPASSIKQTSIDWLTRPMLMGLSLPWLIGLSVLLIAAGWYFLVPDRGATVDSLAFGDDGGLQPVPPEPSAHAGPSFGMPPPQADYSQAILAVQQYAEANRTVIGQQVQTLKAQAAQMAQMQDELKEAQAQISVLTARFSSVAEVKPRAAPKTSVKAVKTVTTSTPLSGMRLSSVQVGMAWVNWQDKTWAVQVGDALGSVTVTSIDAASRQVHTTAGTIE
jgi:intracellular multiplication protein IcmG